MASIQTAPAPETKLQTPGWGWALTAPLWLLPVWGLLALTLAGTPFATASGYLTVVLLAVCSYTDLRWGKIFNLATYTALLWALTVNALDSLLCRPRLGTDGGEGDLLLGVPAARWSEVLGTVGLGESLAGAGLAFVLMLLIYRLAGGGAGDVKLATALGALLGPAALLESLLWTYVAAGVVAVVWVVVRTGPLTLGRALLRRVGFLAAPGWVLPPSTEDNALLQRKVRLAPYFTVGALAVLSGAGTRLVALLGGLGLD